MRKCAELKGRHKTELTGGGVFPKESVEKIKQSRQSFRAAEEPGYS
jgi:hypothetical protein